MSEKINCVLLIDDDDATNYIHKYVLNDANFTDNIKVAGNGQDALDYLTSQNATDYIKPDLIFLDINMPIMDGWEFLERYEELNEKFKSKMVVVMLTTSLNPDDKLKSEANNSIDKFMSKPLTLEMLEDLKSRFSML